MQVDYHYNYQSNYLSLALDDPIPVVKKSGGKAPVNPELIQLIVTMGFTEAQAKFALGETVAKIYF